MAAYSAVSRTEFIARWKSVCRLPARRSRVRSAHMGSGDSETLPPPESSSPVASTPAADGAGATFRRLGSVGPLAIAASVLPFVGLVTVLSQLNNLAPWLR